MKIDYLKEPRINRSSGQPSEVSVPNRPVERGSTIMKAITGCFISKVRLHKKINLSNICYMYITDFW